MSTQTEKYGFTKPEINDPSDIRALNPNWDKVEDELNGLTNDLNTFVNNVNDKVDTLQPKITYGTNEPSGGNSGDVYIQLLEV